MSQTRTGVDMTELGNIIDDQMKVVKEQLQKIHSQDREVNVGDMFEMQLLVNHMNQLSELCSGVSSAMHQASMSSLSKISR